MKQQNILERHPALGDLISVTIFVLCVVVGTLLINSYIFRSFNVLGPSMETTLYTNDRLIVNRVPVTIAHVKNQEYIPNRGDIIVFQNPQLSDGLGDKYLVKRVIGLPGERVVLKDGHFTVYNSDHPEGFDPDKLLSAGTPGSPTSGEIDTTVPTGQVFVAGDHRQGTYSYDSRYGLGTIPSYDIVGPVLLRIYPLNKIRSF